MIWLSGNRKTGFRLARGQKPETLSDKTFCFSKHPSVSEADFIFQKCYFLPQLLIVSLLHRIILAAQNTYLHVQTSGAR